MKVSPMTSGKSLNSDTHIKVPVSLGEFCDRLCILKVKADKLSSQGSLKAVDAEELYQTWLRCGQDAAAFSHKGDYMVLLKRLTDIHSELWDLETSVRNGTVGIEDYVRITEKNNDRHAVKARLDLMAGHLSEPKEYHA